jgi:integral membrane protein
VKTLFNVYRVLALVVGVLLVVGTVGSIFKYLLEDGSSLQQLGDDLTPIWLIHGWIYMVYVAVAFVLTQKARWTLPQFLLMLVAGLVPGLIFWVERRVAERLRAEHPELVRS